jgi:hypothetical protein
MTQYISLDDILRENGIPLSLHRYDRLMASFTKRAKEVGEDAYKLPRADADSWFEHEAKPIILRHDEALYNRNPQQLVSLNDILREHQLPLDIVNKKDLWDSFVQQVKALNNEGGSFMPLLPRADADSWFEHEAKPIILRHDEAMHKRAKPASERDLEHASRIAATEATVKLTSEALRLTAEAVKATSDALASVNKNTQSLLHIVACHEATLSELLGRCEVLKELR